MKLTKEYRRNLEQDNWFYVELGKKLKQARKTKINNFSGKSYVVTQTAVAKAANTTFQQIQKYEKGKNQLSASKIYKLSEFFNIPVSSWFSPIEDFYKEIRDENSTDMVLDN